MFIGGARGRGGGGGGGCPLKFKKKVSLLNLSFAVKTLTANLCFRSTSSVIANLILKENSFNI